MHSSLAAIAGEGAASVAGMAKSIAGVGNKPIAVRATAKGQGSRGPGSAGASRWSFPSRAEHGHHRPIARADQAMRMPPCAATGIHPAGIAPRSRIAAAASSQNSGRAERNRRITMACR